MRVPWEDDVVASTDGEDGREILVQASLKVAVAYLAGRSRAERERIVLAFPDRTSPPYRYEGRDISGLMAELDRLRMKERRQAERQSGASAG